MSLQKCPNCKKKISWWKVYKKINKKRFYRDHLLKCSKCSYKLGLKLKKKTFTEQLFKAFLWTSFPLLLIIAVAMGKMFFLTAIVLVTVYHFIAMHYIITRYKYDTCKK